MDSLITSILSAAQNTATSQLITALGVALLVTTVAGLILWIIRWTFPRLYRYIARQKEYLFSDITIGSYRLISKDSMMIAFLTVLKGVRVIVSLIVIYTAVILIIESLPLTSSLDVRGIIISSVTAFFLLLMARFIMSGIFSMHRFFVRNIHQQTGTTIQPVAIRSVEIFSAARITELLLVLNSMVRFILSVTTVYATLTLVFGLFAFSKKWSMALLDYTMNPLRLIFVSFVNFLPDLIAIIVIITVTRYLLTFIQFLFREVEKGTISFTGFYKEWSIPTYKIVRFLVLAFAVVVIFPYLPGSDTPFFQGISVFLGILISFGSTSAVSNFISGTLVTYMRPFRIGDRVRIADTEGDVIEKSLLVTRLRTIKNVEVTIPNSMVLGSHIINYSVNSRESGLILNTTATIGYDVPWNTVHQLLITAAEKTQYILQNPKPFVLQTALNDFSVVYEINAYTSNANLMANISSELRQNIQNEFNAAGVEILSPHFIALRDGTASTVRPKDKSGKNAPSGITVNVRSKK